MGSITHERPEKNFEDGSEIKPMNFGWGLEGDRVAVKKLESETITKGGIIIPDTAKEPSLKGIIAELGEEITHDEVTGLKKGYCPFYVGQLIQFGKYAGSEIEGEDGEEYIIIRKHDIMAWKKFKK